MKENSQEDKVRKLLNEMEMNMDLGFVLPPFGRFVNTKELMPILTELRHVLLEEKKVEVTIEKEEMVNEK